MCITFLCIQIGTESLSCNIFCTPALYLVQKKTFGLIFRPQLSSAPEVQLKIHSPSFSAPPKSPSSLLPSSSAASMPKKIKSSEITTLLYFIPPPHPTYRYGPLSYKYHFVLSCSVSICFQYFPEDSDFSNSISNYLGLVEY